MLIPWLLNLLMMLPNVINPLFKSCDSMRYYTMTDGVLTCVVDMGSVSGSIEYDFNTGNFIAHKPESMRNIRWFYYLFVFLKICCFMVKSVPDNDELL